MFDSSSTEELFSASEALEAIAELEGNTNQAIVAQRSSKRLDVRIKLMVEPANASERKKNAVPCVTADVSNGGCMVLSPCAILPGDLFWLTFDDTKLPLGSIFGRCLRCRLVREDAFEIGFRFLQDIDVAKIVSQRATANN